jgi:S1-C subfamily serine protease
LQVKSPIRDTDPEYLRRLIATTRAADGGVPVVRFRAFVPRSAALEKPLLVQVDFAQRVRFASDLLVDNGQVVSSRRAAVGITAVTVTDDTAQPIGAGVAAFDPNGPAAAAGVRVGDIITRIERDEIRTAQDLQTRLAERRPGEAVRLTVKRRPAAEPLTMTITLGELAVT